MSEPIACQRCKHLFNAKLPRCPFCGAEHGEAPAPVSKRGPLTCRACHRPFNASFASCPFCHAPAPASSTAPPPRGSSPPPSRPAEPDWSAIAEQTIANNRQLIDLHYHPAAVAALDAFFDQTWGTEGALTANPGWQPTQGQQVAILGFGSFLGEVARRLFGGRWEFNEQNAVLSRVVYANRHITPLAKVYNRLRHGAHEAFEPELYRERLALGHRPTPDEGDGWLRQARHFRAMRPDLTRYFATRGLALGPASEIADELKKLHDEASTAQQR